MFLGSGMTDCYTFQLPTEFELVTSTKDTEFNLSTVYSNAVVGAGGVTVLP